MTALKVLVTDDSDVTNSGQPQSCTTVDAFTERFLCSFNLQLADVLVSDANMRLKVTRNS